MLQIQSNPEPHLVDGVQEVVVVREVVRDGFSQYRHVVHVLCLGHDLRIFRPGLLPAARVEPIPRVVVMHDVHSPVPRADL